MVFRRSQQSESTANDDAPEVSDPAPAGKGRPTPTRKEAEAARKQSLKVPSDPKAAKKALRERERAERQHQREALMRGDESALPPRDRGPAKAFVRNWVDSRRLFSEWFIFLALAVLLLSLIPNQTLRGIVNLSWVVMLIVVIADTSFTVFRIKRALSAEFPNPEDRRGTTMYAIMRAVQIRKLRLPPPKVRPGGAPVVPKQKRN